MSGSPKNSMSFEDLKADRQRAGSLTDWERVIAEDRAGIEPAYDEDNPDATEALKALVARRAAGRPAGSGNKEPIALRIDKDVLAVFKATGKGWQTRMNDALREWIKTHNPA